MHVEVLLDLVVVAVFVSKETTLSVGAEQRLSESAACLRLILMVVQRERLSQEFMTSVCKLALVGISTEPDFDPVLAHLRLVLCLIYSLLSRRRYLVILLLRL